MPLKTIILLCFFLIASSAFAQPDSLASFQFPPKESISTKLEHAGYVIGASMIFSLVDYVGYNLVRGETGAPFSYRLAMVALQSGLSYFLYKQCGLNSAVSFNLIWWTWGDDLGYNLWAIALNAYPRANRIHNDIKQGGITWAWWTPVGLLRKKDSVIALDTLIAQALIGFSISVAIF